MRDPDTAVALAATATGADMGTADTATGAATGTTVDRASLRVSAYSSVSGRCASKLCCTGDIWASVAHPPFAGRLQRWLRQEMEKVDVTVAAPHTRVDRSDAESLAFDRGRVGHK